MRHSIRGRWYRTSRSPTIVGPCGANEMARSATGPPRSASSQVSQVGPTRVVPAPQPRRLPRVCAAERKSLPARHRGGRAREFPSANWPYRRPIDAPVSSVQAVCCHECAPRVGQSVLFQRPMSLVRRLAVRASPSGSVWAAAPTHPRRLPYRGPGDVTGVLGRLLPSEAQTFGSAWSGPPSRASAASGVAGIRRALARQ
jgi:hypothetical protein